MRDTQGLDRAPPDSPGNRKGPQSLTAAAAPRQERRETLPFAFLYPTPWGDGTQSGTDTGSTHYPGDGVIGTYERVDPSSNFCRVAVTFVGAPDDGRRAKLVYDLLWGRWSKPPEDAGVAGPVTHRPPGLTGATAEHVETPAKTA